MKQILAGIFIFFLTTSCHSYPDWGKNNVERDKLLHHYPAGSLKRKAAKFIVENMTFHSSYDNDVLVHFRETVLAQHDSIFRNTTPELLDSLWEKANPFLVYAPQRRDTGYITADFLIEDIDEAFDNREISPWKDSVSFEVFLNAILPYNVANEPLVSRRAILREKYLPMIEGINDQRKAFKVISRYIVANFRLINNLEVYEDPLIMDKLMKGDCNQRSTYMVNVMRALSIPVVYEHIMRCANYSMPVPHSWVALYKSNSEVYVIADKDSVLIKNNKAHYEKFDKKIPYDDSNSPYKVDTAKRMFKMWRNTYATHLRKDVRQKDPNLPSELVDPNKIDVSRFYGMDKAWTIYTKDRYNGNVYICNFGTGTGWLPFDVVAQKGRKIQFKSLNHGICYLPAYIHEDEIAPITNPVIIRKDGTFRHLDPSSDTEPVVLRRKYLLICPFIVEWAHGIGSTFEGSDQSNFRNKETYYTISDVPLGAQNLNISPSKTHRYVRFRSSSRRFRMAEMSFYGIDFNGNQVELKGTVISDSIPREFGLNVFDKDYATDIQPVRGLINKTSYWIGYDLGANNKIKVSRINFRTYSDANFIEEGDLYELFYFDMGWKSLGRRVATTDTLMYHVPKNSVLWLRDLTKGREERIFTYENGKQVWW